MMLDELINDLKLKLLSKSSLEVFCYYHLSDQVDKLNLLDQSTFTGEIEQIAVSSFCGKFVSEDLLTNVSLRLTNSYYRKGLTIYHFLGLSLQDDLGSTNLFKDYLEERFRKQSLRYKYLISKVFERFEGSLRMCLQAEVDTQNHFTLALQFLYLESEIDKRYVINCFDQNKDGLDFIDLMLLEDLQNFEAIGYTKLHEKLLQDIIWIAIEIQNNHKNINNSEDQYNSFFRSFLNSKGYKASDQTQRGVSSSRKQTGELDVLIASGANIPLAIIEAFKLESIESLTIKTHLKKLSENYDPNGLWRNYSIIYSKNSQFLELWERYKKFVLTINFEHKIINLDFNDVTSRFPQFAGIKIGLTQHLNRGKKVEVYHIFMDMNF